jgi:hypothetical protein
LILNARKICILNIKIDSDIGRYSETLDEYFDGKILFVKIWDTPLNKN